MMRSRSTAFRAAVLLVTSATLTLAGCAGDEDAPVTPQRSAETVTAGTGAGRVGPPQRTFTLDLTTPYSDDGGIIIQLSGPNILDITPGAGLEAVENRVTNGAITTATLLIRGNIDSGTIGQMTVRGVNAEAPYSIQVLQAAAGASGGYAQRSDLAEYRVTIRR